MAAIRHIYKIGRYWNSVEGRYELEQGGDVDKPKECVAVTTLRYHH